MWRPPEEIRADLSSGEPRRIAAGLRDLVDAMESVVDEFELPPLNIDLLAPFGDTVPSEVQHDFATLLADYCSFQPPLDREEVLYRLADLSVTYGGSKVALDASMELKIGENPPAMVARILDRLRERGLHNEREVTGAGRYLSYLLDGNQAVREATVAALERWKGSGMEQAIEYVRPQLEAHESRRLSR